MTPKQEAFARAYVETGNASEAYRQSYDAENMGDNTIHVHASKLLRHDKVRIRIEELQERAAKKHDVTIDSLLAELEEARKIAIANPRSVSAAVSASMGKAKLAGLIVDKAEHTGANGAPLVPVLNVSLARNQS
jgi:hypothetical protein